MYDSRRFPLRLSPEGSGGATPSEYGSIMLPLFDLLNHCHDSPIVWKTDHRGITFTFNEDAPVATGAEVFNNYGTKGNEELLMAHGFAIRDNPHDTYSLVLTVCTQGPDTTTGSSRVRRKLGPFQLRLPSEGSSLPQIPPQLWKALSDPVGYANAAAPEDDADEAVEVDAEDCDLLLSTLRQRVAPLTVTALEDARFLALGRDICEENRRRMYVACYRDGQRRVLEAAIAALEQMLTALDGEHEEEEVEEGNEDVSEDGEP